MAGAEPPNRGSNWLIHDIYLCPKSCPIVIQRRPNRAWTSVKQQRSFARSRSPKTHLLKRTCASNFHRERQKGGGRGRQRACVVSCRVHAPLGWLSWLTSWEGARPGSSLLEVPTAKSPGEGGPPGAGQVRSQVSSRVCRRLPTARLLAT